MLNRAYLILGIILCLGMAYANTIGWELLNVNNLGRIGPRGPNIYHK